MADCDAIDAARKECNVADETRADGIDKITMLKNYEHLWDLVRLQRHPLYESGAISNEEFAALVEDHPAVERLVTQDRLQAELRDAREEIERLKHRPVARCQVCGFPLALTRDAGCVEGDCSYRPSEGSEEYRRTAPRLKLQSVSKVELAQERDAALQREKKLLDVLKEIDATIPVHSPHTVRFPHSLHAAVKDAIRESEEASKDNILLSKKEEAQVGAKKG